MAGRDGFASAAVAALTVAYSAIEVKDTTTDDAAAKAVPSRAFLDHLHGQITLIAAGATTITWFIAEDSGGDVPITDEVTETILVGQTTATDGAIKTLLQALYHRSDEGTEDSLWVFAKTDAGTCSLQPRLHFEEGR